MDEALRLLVKELRTLSSEEAADYLIRCYPATSTESGKAYSALSHRSWKKQDQVRLAKEYLKKVPFASGAPYKAFLSFMAPRRMLAILTDFVPDDASGRDLLFYHLMPLLLTAGKTDADKQAISSFKEKFAPKT